MKNAGILYLLLELTLLPPFCESKKCNLLPACMSQRYCLERWNDVSEKAGFKEWYHVTPNHSFILCGIYKNASDCIDDVKQIDDQASSWTADLFCVSSYPMVILGLMQVVTLMMCLIIYKGRKGIQEKESAKHQKDSWIKETPTNEDKSDSCPKAVEDSNIDRHRNKSVESISKSNINNGSITGNITIINGNAIYSTKRSPRFCRCRNVINHENIESDGIGADMDHSPAIESKQPVQVSGEENGGSHKLIFKDKPQSVRYENRNEDSDYSSCDSYFSCNYLSKSVQLVEPEVDKSSCDEEEAKEHFKQNLYNEPEWLYRLTDQHAFDSVFLQKGRDNHPSSLYMSLEHLKISNEIRPNSLSRPPDLNEEPTFIKIPEPNCCSADCTEPKQVVTQYKSDSKDDDSLSTSLSIRIENYTDYSGKCNYKDTESITSDELCCADSEQKTDDSGVLTYSVSDAEDLNLTNRRKYSTDLHLYGSEVDVSKDCDHHHMATQTSYQTSSAYCGNEDIITNNSMPENDCITDKPVISSEICSVVKDYGSMTAQSSSDEILNVVEQSVTTNRDCNILQQLKPKTLRTFKFEECVRKNRQFKHRGKKCKLPLGVNVNCRKTDVSASHSSNCSPSFEDASVSSTNGLQNVTWNKRMCSKCHRRLQYDGAICDHCENSSHSKKKHTRPVTIDAVKCELSSGIYDSGHESSIEEIVSWSGWRRTLNEFCQRWKNRDLEIAKDVTRRLYIDYFSDLSNPEIYGLRTYFDRLNTGIPMTQEEQRQFEWLRFVSFYQYQGNGNGIALARNGFCHNPEDGPNSTHCFACDARYNEWEMFDNVVEIHTRLSPNCPLLHGNIGEGTRRNISIVSDDVPRRRPAQQQTAVTAEPTGRNVQDSQPARSTSSSSAAAAATSGASSVSSVAATSTTSSAGSFIHSHLPSQSRNPIATSLTRVSGLGNFGRPVPTTTQQVTVPSSAKPESPFSAPSTSASAIASSASAVGGIAASVADTHISSGSQHSGFTSMQPTSDPNNTDRMYHLNPTTQIRGMGMVDEPYNEISVPPPQQGISVSGVNRPSSILGNEPVGAGAFFAGQPQSMPVSGHTQVSELRSSSVPLVQGLSGSPGLTPHQEARPPPPSTQQALSYQQRGQGLGGGSGPGDAPPDRARGTGLPGLDPDLTAGIHIVSPRHPDYNTLTARINSFSGWPSHLDQNPRMMGEAGFFYVGVADFCRCYACGGGLRNWQPGDDPVLEHARWFPQCEYIIKLKGQAFVTEIQRHVSNLSASNSTPAETPRLSENNSQDPLDCETGRQLMSMGFPQARTRRAIRALRITHGRDPTPDEVLDWMLEDHTDSESEDTESATPAATSQPTSSITHSSTTTTTTSNLTTAPTGSINVSVTSSTSYFSRGASQENSQREATPSTSTNQREQTPSGKLGETTTSEGSDLRREADVLAGNSEKQEPKNGGGKNKKKRKKGKGGKSSQEEGPGATEGASGGPEEEESNDNGTQIRQENEKLREMQTCKICMERQVNTTLLPCGHLVSCDRCASRLAKCPICRTKIKGSVKTFMT
ncbi:uncharacterized protein LOC128237123 isoform X2 [Mya arenaria]|uniref:uncharacterized protein LOC128237123 isoform X2 n=1 Tax=Mya arenaria TaxID=6604 RepID=UPI0022E533E6|nr:uncharacterized protein LOC128237123 isoform X2 [Mya arenaria]